jgi:hypothetical protein
MSFSDPSKHEPKFPSLPWQKVASRRPTGFDRVARPVSTFVLRFRLWSANGAPLAPHRHHGAVLADRVVCVLQVPSTKSDVCVSCTVVPSLLTM